MRLPIKHSSLPLLKTLSSLNWAIKQEPPPTRGDEVSKGGWVGFLEVPVEKRRGLKGNVENGVCLGQGVIERGLQMLEL